MDSEEFENRANIAAKVADRLGLTGIPAVRSETASSTGAAAFHEAYYKIASGECESVLVLAGERMKTVTTEVATAIMSKTVDPEERRFGFTMPALIALVTQAWFRERGIEAEAVARRAGPADAAGARPRRGESRWRPSSAGPSRSRPTSTRSKNLPVATPLTRKDCSPICDGAAAVILTAKPQAVRVAGLGSATETSSILDRSSLSPSRRHATGGADRLLARRDRRSRASSTAWSSRSHDAFNSLLPIGLVDLGLVDADDAIEALMESPRKALGEPLEHPLTGIRGRIPTNLSGGLKARGHPVGGTGLFQIAENYLQLTERFPNPRAQVPRASLGIAHSIGGPGNNVYVTILERSDSRRKREVTAKPRLHFQSAPGRAAREDGAELHGALAVVEAATTIFVTPGRASEPVHVAVLRIDGRRMFAKLDRPANAGEVPEEVFAGQKVKFLVKDDGDHYFQVDRGRSRDFGRIVDRVRTRLSRGRSSLT